MGVQASVEPRKRRQSEGGLHVKSLPFALLGSREREDLLIIGSQDGPLSVGPPGFFVAYLYVQKQTSKNAIAQGTLCIAGRQAESLIAQGCLPCYKTTDSDLKAGPSCDTEDEHSSGTVPLSR